jgi:hypothetical protein
MISLFINLLLRILTKLTRAVVVSVYHLTTIVSVYSAQ